LTVKKLNNKFAVTNMKNIIKSASIFLLLSCSTGSQPINYGKDNCDFCKMTIMDQKFGTEIVTKKGKIYKFDSDECMRNFYNKNISEIVTLNIYMLPIMPIQVDFQTVNSLFIYMDLKLKAPWVGI